MEENDVARTVEGLRGRLVAERAISRAAKDDARLMGNKVMELENKLREETKSKKQAEKKLVTLIKKLESLKINYVSEESEQRSRISSASAGVRDPEEIKQSKPQVSSSMNSDMDQNPKRIVAETISTEQNESSPSNEGTSTTTLNTVNYPDPNSDQKDASPEEIKQSSCSLNSSNGEEEKRDDSVDNSISMALVLVPESLLQVASSESIDKPEMVIRSSVSEVLDALRHAREQIQRALVESRHVFNAGSSNTRIC